MNLLTRKELYCLAKVLQSVLFSDDRRSNNERKRGLSGYADDFDVAISEYDVKKRSGDGVKRVTQSFKRNSPQRTHQSFRRENPYRQRGKLFMRLRRIL